MIDDPNDALPRPELTLIPVDELHSGEVPSALSPGSTLEATPVPQKPIQIPSLLNTFQFFAMAFTVTLIMGLASVALFQLLPPFRHEDLKSLALDARLTIPSQAIQYLTLLAATVALFKNLWQRPFWQAIHWNGLAVARRWMPLVATGLALGLLNGVASNLLPMPKEAPILNNLMRSPTGAWLMFAFGTTMAPLVEELAFRGFLLPSLVNFFRRFGQRRQPLPDSTPDFGPSLSSSLESSAHRSTPALIILVSIVIASLPFALLHGQQVSWAWAPVLLIGIVSVALCIVRLWTNSLAASTFVHATYNFTLFAGMMIASDGFRHLDKLNN